MGIFNFGFGSSSEELKPHKLGPAAPVHLRKGFDPNGRPWTPEIVIVQGASSNAQVADILNRTDWERDLSGGQQVEGLHVRQGIHSSREQGIVAALDANAGFLYPNLQQGAFFLAARVKSSSLLRKNFCIRFFMAPEAHVADHQAWIELGRMTRPFAGSEKRVCVLPQEDVRFPSGESLPSDLHAFSRYRVLLMVTDPWQDQLKTSDCGCGARDSCEADDGLPWNFPFDRPLSEDIEDMIARRKDCASRTVEVLWE